jgi:hemerythrin
MPFLKWSDSFCIGDERLDSDHKGLFDILNRLHVELLKNNRREAADKAIVELLDYSKRHFSGEEEVMKAVGFLGYEEHKACHDELIQKLQDYESRRNNGDQEATRPLYGFLLGDWLWKHIIEMDMKIAPYIAKHQSLLKS